MGRVQLTLALPTLLVGPLLQFAFDQEGHILEESNLYLT